MIVADRAEHIAALASARTPAGRAELLLAVTELCDRADAQGALDRVAVDTILSNLLLQLIGQVERDIRLLLSQRLADAPWAPPALVNLLALDEIEIARPVIAASPVLSDADLVRILLTATLEHQVAVAGRPSIGPEVVSTILARKEPVVWTALAGNHTAAIDATGVRTLVEAVGDAPAIGEALAGHPALQPDDAAKLYLWVGQSLRDELQARFRFDPQDLSEPLAHAISQAYGNPFGWTARHAGEVDGEDQQEYDRRLVDKLHAAGQLRSSYLLRSLREGKLGLFEATLAKLADLPLTQVRRAVDASSPVLLALACTALGLDRSVFPSVLCLVRDLNEGRPGGEAADGMRAAEAFAAFPPERAAEAVRRMAI